MTAGEQHPRYDVDAPAMSEGTAGTVTSTWLCVELQHINAGWNTHPDDARPPLDSTLANWCSGSTYNQ